MPQILELCDMTWVESGCPCHCIGECDSCSFKAKRGPMIHLFQPDRVKYWKMFLPIFITIFDPQLWPNKCNLYENVFIAHVSFPWNLKEAFCYKCVPNSMQSVISRLHFVLHFCEAHHTSIIFGWRRFLSESELIKFLGLGIGIN